MNEKEYQIREFRPRDYAQEAKVQSRLDPGTIYTAEELRHFEERVLAPPMVQFKIVAEERSSGEAVGFGYLQSDLEGFDPRTFWTIVGIDPDHQRLGLGFALATRIHREAERRGARNLWAGIRADDARAVRFLDQQGFTERRRSWRSRLDLARAVSPPDRTATLTQQGISFTTLAEEDLTSPELLRDLYDLTASTSADEPRLGTYTPVSFEQFVERDLRGPSFLPEANFLAREQGRLVAMSVLQRSEGDPGILRQSFTGTRRELRGRGIATELKRRAVEYGRSHGFQSLQTGNDSRNHPMLAINRKLGFEPEVVRILAEKSLED